MEAINSGVFDIEIIYLFVKKLFLGTVAFGFLVGGLYFAYYLLNLYRLPRQSKQYRHQCENLQAENLIRYIVTIACMLLVSGLFYFGLEIGQQSMHLGAIAWGLYYSTKFINQKLRERRLNVKGQENKI